MLSSNPRPFLPNGILPSHFQLNFCTFYHFSHAEYFFSASHISWRHHPKYETRKKNCSLKNPSILNHLILLRLAHTKWRSVWLYRGLKIHRKIGPAKDFISTPVLQVRTGKQSATARPLILGSLHHETFCKEGQYRRQKQSIKRRTVIGYDLI